MKIFKCEIYKIISTPIFLGTIIIAILFNLYINLTSEKLDISDKFYNNFYLELTENSSENIEKKLSDDLYENSFSYEKYLENEFIKNEYEQALAVENYDEYLSGIVENAENMTAVSIFAKKDSFTYKNIVKTPKAYEKVSGVLPEYVNSEGVLLAVNCSSADILLIFSVIVVVMILIGKERESGIFALLKPLKFGRKKLAFVKIIILFLFTVLIAILLYLTGIIVGEYRFGLPDLSLPVQSLKGFIGCNLPINIFSFLIFTFLIKIFSAFFIGLIFWILSVKFSSVISIIFTAVIAVFEIILYLNISILSAFSPFSVLNFASFMNSSDFFITYSNMNLLGLPINALVVSVVTIFLGIIFAIFFAVRSFCRISVSSVSKISIKLPFTSYIPKKAFTYTLYKIFVTHKGLLIIAAVLFLQIYTAVNYEKTYNPNDENYRFYCETLASLDEKSAEEFIQNEAEKFEELKLAMMSGGNFGAINSSQNELNKEYGFEKARTQFEYIKTLSTENKAKFYQTGFEKIFGVQGYNSDMKLALIATISLCLIVLPYFSYDKKCRIGFILNTTKLGKNAYLKHNFIAMVLVSIVISFAVYIPYFIMILSTYGTAGLEFSINCISTFENFADISVSYYLVLLFVLRMAILAIFSAILNVISLFCKSPSVALIIGILVFALPIIIYLLGYDFAIYFSLPLSVNREIMFLL